MQRTTIMADEATLERLRELAHERSVSLASLIREALEEKARSARPRPMSLGSGESGQRATAQSEGSLRQPPRSWR